MTSFDFPTLQSQLANHTLADLLADGTLSHSELLAMFGAFLTAQLGGAADQALVKNSNVDGDFSYVDIAELSDDFPLPDSSAAPGISVEAARSDHVHPAVGAAGGVGLVQSYVSTSNGVTFSSVAPGLNLIDINPSPTLVNGHHYLWVFSGEWTDTNTGGFTALNFLDASDVVLSRVVTNAINVRRSGVGIYLEDGTGSTVHRKLNVLAAATNTGSTTGASVPYRVLLLDLGNQ